MTTRFSEGHRWAIMLAAVALAAGIGALAASWTPRLAVFLVIAIAITLLIPIVVRMLQGRFDIFEPPVFFLVAYGTLFVAKPIEMLADSDYSYYFAPSVEVIKNFDRMLILALLGAIAFVVGYFLGTGRALASRLPSPPSAFSDATSRWVAVAVAGVGLLSFGLFLAQGGGLSLSSALGGRTDELLTIATATPKYLAFGSLLLIGPAVLLLALAMRRRRPLTVVLASIVTATAIVVRGSSGSRIAMLPLFGGIILFWYLQRDKRPRAIPALLFLVISIVVSSAIYYGRVPTTGVGAVQNYVNGLEKSTSSISGATDPLLKSADASMAAGLAASMNVIPDKIGYGYGRFVTADALTRAVPRQLLPSKPKPPQAQVTEEVAPRPGHRPFLLAYSVLMHAYLDFGMFGAIWLMGYGIASRALFEWFRLNRRSEIAMAIVAVSLPFMAHAMRDGPVDTLFNIAAVAFPILAAWWLSRKPRSRRARTAG